MNKTKIIIVDKNSLFLNIMKQFLITVLRCEIIGIATNGEAFLNMKNIRNADIIFMDIEMSGINGFQSAIEILKNIPQAKIIAVSMYHDNDLHKMLLECGYKGLVSKTNFYSEIIPAMNKVMQGGVYSNKVLID